MFVFVCVSLAHSDQSVLHPRIKNVFADPVYSEEDTHTHIDEAVWRQLCISRTKTRASCVCGKEVRPRREDVSSQLMFSRSQG